MSNSSQQQSGLLQKSWLTVFTSMIVVGQLGFNVTGSQNSSL